jgi:hypothetical protein
MLRENKSGHEFTRAESIENKQASARPIAGYAAIGWGTLAHASNSRPHLFKVLSNQ